jgi:predicted Zn-dependent peptidase
VLARLLDWGAGTRLADRVLEAPGWLDAASADYWTGELGGQLELWAGGSKRRLRAMSRLLDRALWSLETDPPSETLLQRAKVSLIGELLDSLEDPEQRAFAMAECIARGDPPDCTLTEIDQIRAVGPADIQRVLDAYLRPERQSRLDVVPVGARPPRGAEEVILP